MTTYLGKSCSFCLPRVPFGNCRQFMYLVISLLVLMAGYRIWLYQFLIIAYLFTLLYQTLSHRVIFGRIKCHLSDNIESSSYIHPYTAFIFYKCLLPLGGEKMKLQLCITRPLKRSKVKWFVIICVHRTNITSKFSDPSTILSCAEVGK